MNTLTTRLLGHPALQLRSVLTLVLGVCVLTLAAKVQIPFWPVPMTLHLVAVMGFAVMLGPQRAVAIFLAYLAAGAAGFPVFSGTPERGIGLAYMVGPTGGYLAGFLVASALTGRLAAGRGILGRFGAMLAGLLVIYACGAAWLAMFVPADKVLGMGILPFLPGDLVKITLVACGASLLTRRTQEDRG